MKDQLNLIDMPISLMTLPTAKVRPSDKIGVHAWTRFYAAFSERFVSSAISALGVTEDDVLLDPFVGSGTTLVAAMKAGVRVVGVDLDPFACLLARAKVAVRADEKVVRKLLSVSPRPAAVDSFSHDAKAAFSVSSLANAGSVFVNVGRRIGVDPSGILEIILSDQEGAYDSEAVALAAICIGASESSGFVKGSNPTWNRRPVPGEKFNRLEIEDVAERISYAMLGDLAALKADHPNVLGRQTRIINSNIKELGGSVRRRSISRFIGSPPYLTRIDYVIKHLPNLLIMSGLTDIDIESLRRQMIGTPKVVKKGEFNEGWGKESTRILNKIRTHASYASESYYLWMYYQYFDSIYEAIQILRERLKVGGKGLFVVQDSFYKDVEVNLGQIYVEMLSGSGFSASIVGGEEVVRNLRDLNPARASIDGFPKSVEHVIYAERRG